MADNQPRQCAHKPCNCTVPEGQKYCSDYCKSAGSDEVEIACDCDHPPCSQ